MKLSLKESSSTIDSLRFSAVQLDTEQYYIWLKSNELQTVMISMQPQCLLIEAIEMAISYFKQLNTSLDLSDKIDDYDIYRADKAGNSLDQNKISHDLTLSETKSNYFIMSQKKYAKSKLLSMLKQPIKKPVPQVQVRRESGNWYDNPLS